MSAENKQWTPSKDDIDFLAKLNEDLESLDFYHKYSSDASKYDENSRLHYNILLKIKNVKDIDLQEVAITLYDLHVYMNDGELSVKWEWFLED